MEIVAFVPTEIGICRTCDEVARAFKISLTENSEYKDFEPIAILLSQLGDTPVRITGPMTLRGLYLMARHRTGRLPLIIINDKLVHKGPIKNPIELAERIKSELIE
nr:MAG: hypothetical protein TU35_07450 [Thermoproteus sp. AZ2]